MVTVETVRLSTRANDLCYQVRTAQLPDDGHPDALARELAGFASGSGDPARLLHSTSWRFDGGSVVLTYAALPDPDPAAARPLDPARPLPYALDPLSPVQVRPTPEDVAVHACRHLAYLLRTDPVVAAAAANAPDLWGRLKALHPTMAGLLVQPAR